VRAARLPPPTPPPRRVPGSPDGPVQRPRTTAPYNGPWPAAPASFEIYAPPKKKELPANDWLNIPRAIRSYCRPDAIAMKFPRPRDKWRRHFFSSPADGPKTSASRHRGPAPGRGCLGDPVVGGGVEALINGGSPRR
jgi:hypothetical protein